MGSVQLESGRQEAKYTSNIMYFNFKMLDLSYFLFVLLKQSLKEVSVV